MKQLLEEVLDRSLSILADRHPYSIHLLGALSAWKVLGKGNSLEESTPEQLLGLAYFLLEEGHLEECCEICDLLDECSELAWDLYFLRLLSGKLANVEGSDSDLLFGLSMANFAKGDSLDRQEYCQEHNSKNLSEVLSYNLHLPEDKMDTPYTNLEVLEDCSWSRLGRKSGPRKPIVKEVFARLARIAKDEGRSAFLFANSDVVLTPRMLDLIVKLRSEGIQNLAFTRTDLAGCGSQDRSLWRSMHIGGSDAFLVDVEWWLQNEDSFDSYIIGETDWDTVYCGIMATRSRFYYCSHTRGLLLHPAHAQRWDGTSEQAKYNMKLRDGEDAIFFLLHKMYYQEVRGFVTRNRSLPTFVRNREILRMFKAGDKLR